jgi:ribonuclease Y
MSGGWTLAAGLAGVLAGGVLGAAGYAVYARVRGISSRRQAADMLKKAVRDARTLRHEAELAARDYAMRGRETLEAERREHRKELQAVAARLEERAVQVDRDAERVRSREAACDAREAAAAEERRSLEERSAEVGRREAETEARREALAGVTPAEARAEILEKTERELAEERAGLVRKMQAEARAEAEAEARRLVTTAIQRYAAEQTASVSTTVVRMPEATMKGRIIGREGRNIRALEAATGVTFLIDDSPDAIILSSFDPIRREIAKTALERLIESGRINPALVEEAVKQATADIDKLTVRAGEDAVEELNLARVAPDVLRPLGRLRFRTSFSQNVLRHSVEAATLAGMMAAELGLSVETAKRAALFHDIGKALDAHAGERHAEAGAALLRKAGEPPAVVNAVLAHHGEAGEQDAYALLTAAADAITAARPGAREGNAQEFLRRMERLEALAAAEPGVARALAMQAGRELRVFVTPEAMDDAAAILLARKLARTIEQNLDYPGQIKVTVIRETRCVEYAK